MAQPTLKGYPYGCLTRKKGFYLRHGRGNLPWQPVAAGSHSYDRLERAVHLVRNGAKLIGTNPDLTDPTENGVVPATGALIAPIELATGLKAYFVGKPNPLMMRHALKRLGCRREETVIVGDRMDTDIIAGLESEIETVLVLSGVTSREDLHRFAYRPRYILDGVGDIVP